MKTFVIGVPRERKMKEGRVGMTPEGVHQIRSEYPSVSVLIEKDAGVLSGFSDLAYLHAGAVIMSDTEDIYRESDLIVKVKEPIPEEYKFLRHLHHKTLFTYLHLAGVDPELTRELVRNEVTAIAYESVEQWVNGRRALPLLVPMSTIAGTQGMRQGILHARNHGCSVPRVIIIGGGVVGEAALKEATQQRVASVSLFEMRKERVQELRTRYRKLNGSSMTTILFMTMNTMNTARGKGIFSLADVVVSAVLNPGDSAPKVLTAQHFAQIKQGCYVVDVAIDQGGSTEWSRQTKPGETYEQGGLTFSCVANIPGSTVPRDATIALSTATLPYIQLFAQHAMTSPSPSEWWLLKDHFGLRQGLQTWRGCVVNSFVAIKHKMESVYKPLDSFF